MKMTSTADLVTKKCIKIEKVTQKKPEKQRRSGHTGAKDAK